MNRQRDPQTYQILGAAFAVHAELGCGFLERVYQEALAVEFELRDVPFARERSFPVSYRGRTLHCDYVADFVCYDAVVVELKAVERLNDNHRAQVLNNLKVSGLQRALLLNFGTRKLEYERIVLGYTPQPDNGEI